MTCEACVGMTWLLWTWLRKTRWVGPPCALSCAPHPAGFFDRLARDGTKVSSEPNELDAQ